MSYDWFSIIFTFAIFVTIMIIFSRENADYVAFSLLGAALSSLVTFFRFPEAHIIESIEWKPLIFILSMQVIVLIAERHKIFQWVAVKSLHLTKGNHRIFFYLICIIGTFTASIIADVTVSIIFVPLVIRACRILKINPAPYLYGITITINIGSIFTPFSSSENILISSSFDLSVQWFFMNTGIFVILALIGTLILLDFFLLRKNSPPSESQKNILLEIMNPELVIIDRKQFITNSIYFIIVILGFVFMSDYAFLVALFGAIIMSLLNRNQFTDNLTKIDWKVIFFFISLFLIIGNMIDNGTFALILSALQGFSGGNLWVLSFSVLIITSLLSGFLANSPTAIIGINLLNEMFNFNPPAIIIIAFLLGINLGGNLLPQGAACDVMTLNLAMKHKVEGFTYKSLLRTGGAFAVVHIVMCILYLTGYYFVVY
ncbi:MAG: SLC13 family permease [Promethearchaeota archaeon]